MEFDETKRKSPSTRKMLLNQVHENSDMCDVTIKLGLWEKRFHWCVLVASPYFENIRKHSYLERDSGIVSMNIGTPVSLEEGILFLYGKKPKITPTNVEHFLEIAEYLQIPGLKSYSQYKTDCEGSYFEDKTSSKSVLSVIISHAECVHWIKGSRITDDTCFVMLKLASVYNFNLTMYEEYVLGHIPDLMQTDAMMELTEDSVEYILSDPSLSYVTTTDLFLFLVHWTNCRGNRKQYFHKLLKHINFEDVDQSFITDVVISEPLINELDEATDLIDSLKSIRSITTCDLFICPDKYIYGKLPCFDLTRHRWSSVNLEQSYPEGFNSRMVREIVAVKGKDHSDVYILQTSYTYDNFGIVMYSLNLETNNVKKSQLSVLESEVKPNFGEQISCFHKNEVFLISNERVKCADNVTGGRHTTLIDVATMYVGKIEDDTTTISVKAVISLRGEISHISANKTVIAMLNKDSGLMYLFNIHDCSMERASLIDRGIALDRSYKLTATGSGFVIYNGKRFTSVARQIGPNLHSNYLINQYNFSPNKHEDIFTRYHFCENRWYQYTTKRDGQPTFCFTTHEKLMSLAQDAKTKPDGPLAEIWETLPTFESLGSNIFQITLSKDRLSCALNCPHCKQQKERESDGDDYTYYDDDNDDSDDDDYDYDDDDDDDDDDDEEGDRFFQTLDGAWVLRDLCFQ